MTGIADHVPLEAIQFLEAQGARAGLADYLRPAGCTLARWPLLLDGEG